MAPKNASQSYCERTGVELTSGFKRYPVCRDKKIKNSQLWLEGKRKADGYFPHWRIYDGLYDLTDFIDKHPGGRFWVEETQGMDITESFESSHIGQRPKEILQKYFVKKITAPRNSPYTFHENDFYMTLKRRIEPILKEKGCNSSTEAFRIQDGLLYAFLVLFFIANIFDSILTAIIAGVVLGLAVLAAHNYFHQKDNWRMYIFDLMLVSSQEWRISHALSHHVFPNTIYDYEIEAFEPHLNMLPRKKSMWERSSLVTCHIVMLIGFFIDAGYRIITICRGLAKARIENTLPYLQLILCIYMNATITRGFWLWLCLHLSANYTFLIIGLTSAHQHPNIYHEGDKAIGETDWGVLQVVVTRDRVSIIGNLFLVMVSFGNHTLHHLFPTVDHSKLVYLWPTFVQTCKEFGIQQPEFSAKKLFFGFYLLLVSQKPNPNPPAIRKTK